MNVLLFATAASMCAGARAFVRSDSFEVEKDSKGSCMEGGAYQLPVNLIGACIGASNL